jgi:preprotein translocase subunit SecF
MRRRQGRRREHQHRRSHVGHEVSQKAIKALICFFILLIYLSIRFG